MSMDARWLYELLPAIHRSRDEEAGGPLKAFLGIVGEQIALLEEDLAQLYDDQFIETCADWVAPYIGDLVGYRQLQGATPQISSPRAEVADTIRLRRGKGTAATLEELARDVTGWDAQAVEFFRLLATTQYLNHLRPDNLASPDLRKFAPIELVGGPSDRLARTASIRGPARGGLHNIPIVGIFLWRLQSLPILNAAATKIDANRYVFDPFGAPTALFALPEDSAGAMPLDRRLVDADLAAFYGVDKSFFIAGVAIDALKIANLSDASPGVWAHAPAAGQVFVDPALGRIAFGTAPAAPPLVSYHYASASDLGGGAYDRLVSFEAFAPLVAVPGQAATIQAALDAVAGGGTAEISGSGRFAETPSIKANGAGARLELRAADKLPVFMSVGGDVAIAGADGSEITVNGLLISGGRLRVAATPDNKLARLTLRHCTLVPGISRDAAGQPAQPALPSLVVETGANLVIDHCILGGLRLVPGAQATITNSVIDATSNAGVAFAALDGSSGGGALTISDSTIIGKVHTSRLQASNVIFAAGLAAGDTWAAPVWADRRQSGFARFCYLPPGSRAPRPYSCQPSDACPDARPVFASLRYGDPAYGQLSRRTSPAIRQGADDGSEMGVFRELAQPQREANLRQRMDEYLRFGLEAGFVFVT
ncbi:MAG TPA: hypothetical protein VMU18_12215 [Rhodoblastus sp.]|nr:hypothetical protein [Rhodoblastus sp.]